MYKNYFSNFSTSNVPRFKRINREVGQGNEERKKLFSNICILGSCGQYTLLFADRREQF